jgi:nucleotide-binding universal stress UspA family protein
VVEPDTAEAVGAVAPTGLSRNFEAAEAAAAAHAKRLLDHFRQCAKTAGVPFHSHFVRTGQIDQAIVAAADAHRCDLIVMVTHGRGAFGEMLFGSHTKNVMSRSKVPLLVLH